MKVIYRITFPNGKIYIGMDLTDTITYFGSPSAKKVIEKDFTPEQRLSFTIKKEIIWESDAATDREVREMEIALIILHRSNDPAIGYNRWPRVRALAETVEQSEAKL